MIRGAFGVIVCLAVGPSALGQDRSFDVRFLPVHGRRMDTVIYDFTGDGVNDLLNSSIDFDVDPPVRWLALHVQRRAAGFETKPDFIWSIRPTAAALTFGDYVPGGGVEICTVTPDGVYYYPFENGQIVEEPRKLIHARTFFSSPSPRALPIWMWVHDLSGEGLHDLVLPTPDGYRVYFQTEPGRFGKVSRLELDVRALVPARFPEQLDFVASLFNLQVRLPRLAIADIDGDGRLDLATAQGNVLHYFFQRQPGEYRLQRGWTSRYPVDALQEELKKDQISYLQVDFQDIDGDKCADLVVTKVEGQVGLFDSLRTRISLHVDRTGKGKYEPNLYISIYGVSIDPQFIDMNGDGKLDVLTSRLRTDLVNQALTAGIFGDISVDYEVFQFDPQADGYSESPVYSYPVRVTLDDIEKKGAASRPLLFVTRDLTGDGRPDQVRVDPRTDTLEVHPGRDRGRRIDFDPTAHHEIKLDRYPKFITFYDVNADGLQDMLLYYGGSVGVVVKKKP
ncbi:MAG: VCBS repeat-containing protein [Planctomycetes bacterium]|nr:VCBS repeat-containing protein [Planctomycetota bacterium]